MKFSNELKVGALVVIAALIFIVGVRYFEDIPLFSGTYELRTSFEDAGGLIKGNPVRINGVDVGRVESVRLNTSENIAEVLFHVDEGITIPEGSQTLIGGTSLLGAVRLDINLGSGTETYNNGDYVPSVSETGLDALFERAPGLVDRADSLLIGVNATVASTQALIEGENSSLNQTLRALQSTALSLNQLIRTEQQRLGHVLAGVDTLTGNLNDFTVRQNDSLAIAIGNLNRVLTRMDQNLASLESTTTSLDAAVTKINEGDGTMSLLINDPSLYYKLDSTLTSFDRLLTAFEENPKRFLKDLKLVDVF
ncbi:MAG TPA: MlaD family protein [Rhodothermales bacterium]|nr:MlaD family protein [Rhodothermales bacterium]